MKQTILRIIILFAGLVVIKSEAGTGPNDLVGVVVGPVAGFFLPHSQKMVENLVSNK